VLKGMLYDTLVLAQEFMLIWRLYVVFMCDWRVVIFPTILAVVCTGITYKASAMFALPGVGLYVASDLLISAWVLDMILNLSVTVAITSRLWWMNRKLASLTDTRANRYASSMYVVIESGAISAVTNIVMLALYTSNAPVSLAGLDVASQLVALTPLLIVVQVGLTGRYRIPNVDSSRTLLTAQDEITFRVGLPREQDSLLDLPLRTTLSHSSGPAHGAHV